MKREVTLSNNNNNNNNLFGTPCITFNRRGRWEELSADLNKNHARGKTYWNNENIIGNFYLLRSAT